MGHRSPGDWCIGNTAVSKTATPGSIPGSPARWGGRFRSGHDGRYPEVMAAPRDIELVFAPQEEGGYHVYAPDLPGLHSEGDTFDEAMENAREALELYVEGLREVGRSLDAGVVRRRVSIPA
jgi:predicted RNase H-like HicB family nuclease